MAAEGLNDTLDITAGAAPLVGSFFGPVGTAAGGLLGMGLRAFSQYNRSKNTKVPKRPVAITPQGIIENQQNSRQIASGALADASNVKALQALQQNQATVLNAARQSARSSTDVLATLGRLNQNTNNGLNSLAQNKYNQRLGGFGMLSSANQNQANFDDRNFMYNKVEPYNQAVQNKQNLLTASNTNFDRAGQYASQNALGMEYMRMSNPNYRPSRGVLDWWNTSRKRKPGIRGTEYLNPNHNLYNAPIDQSNIPYDGYIMNS